MKKNPTVFLQHILESIDLIEKYMKNLDLEKFCDPSATEVQDAVMRRFSIIGEAANNIPEEIKSVYADVEWRDIIGLRNILMHEYFGVSLQEVFDTATRDIHVLKEKIQVILSKISQES